MITVEKIKIFNSYGGDIDGLARNSRTNDHNLITDNEWALIDNFLKYPPTLKTADFGLSCRAIKLIYQNIA